MQVGHYGKKTLNEIDIINLEMDKKIDALVELKDYLSRTKQKKMVFKYDQDIQKLQTEINDLFFDLSGAVERSLRHDKNKC
jgi:hypothetical protein